MTHRVEQGQPELLGVLLVAWYLQQSEPALLLRTAGPGAQQGRLPAAGRSGDDRHLPRRCAIQGSDKITPVDQPGSRRSHTASVTLVYGLVIASNVSTTVLMPRPSGRQITGIW